MDVFFLKKHTKSVLSFPRHCKHDTARICCCEYGSKVGRAVQTRRAAIDRNCLPAGLTTANPSHADVAGKWDRQTDGRTPYRNIDPVAYFNKPAVPYSKGWYERVGLSTD